MATGCTNKSQHEVLLDFLLNNSLSQLISQATSPTSNNILDLLMTSSQNLIENIQAVPGISDHLAIIFDVNLKPHIPRKPSRKVYQFHKADKISLKMKAKAVLDKCIKSDPIKNDINTNWCTIKSILNNLLNDYVPYKTTKTRHNLPWITNEIKHSMRKRDIFFLRSTYKIACLCYHCHSSTAPSYVTDMLHRKPLHTRNTRSSSYTIPLLNRPAHSKATLGDRSFSFASSSVWKSIPNDVMCAPSLSSFKSCLKTYLFRSVYKD